MLFVIQLDVSVHFANKGCEDVSVIHKQTITSETRLYDNSLGSRLLFEARAEALRTLPYKRRFDDAVTASVCRSCGTHDKTVAEVILDCWSL